MKAAFIFMSSAAMRTSQPSAMEKPPPAAAPLIRPMMGCGQRRMRITRPLKLRWLCSKAAASRCSVPLAALMSSPAQKARPAPRSTTTRTAVWVSARSK